MQYVKPCVILNLDNRLFFCVLPQMLATEILLGREACTVEKGRKIILGVLLTIVVCLAANMVFTLIFCIVKHPAYKEVLAARFSVWLFYCSVLWGVPLLAAGAVY